MTIAYYGKNTERNVRAFLAQQSELKAVSRERSIEAIRSRKQHADKVIRSIEEANRLAKERLQRERAEANEAIERANRALIAFRKSNTTTFATIVKRISKATGITPHEIMSNRRNEKVVFARQAICYWACRRTLLSLPEIGKKLGGRDHTTILHGKCVYPVKRAAQSRNLRKVR